MRIHQPVPGYEPACQPPGRASRSFARREIAAGNRAALQRCCLLLLLAAAAVPAAGSEPPPARAPFEAEQARQHQQAWAEYLGIPVQVRNAIGMQFLLIPPGQFAMGSPVDEKGRQNAETLHQVTITRPFYMAATEVTQKQWKAVMGTEPSFCTGDQLPVDTVPWGQAAEFCRRLSKQEEVAYRLPTEAEWEYACRAGTATAFHTGETIHTDQANYDGNYTYANGRKGAFREQTTAAGSLAANAWGLGDMHGNVWEWCADWFGQYPQHQVSDPAGPASGDRRVLRGGCWINFPAVCRSANRAGVAPRSWNFHTGFRVARDVQP